MYRYRVSRSQACYIIGLGKFLICIGIEYLDDERVVGAGESTSSAFHCLSTPSCKVFMTVMSLFTFSVSFSTD